MFQSTHPRRVWLMEYFHNTRVIGFNPHTHAGCDKGLRILTRRSSSFNPHTHAGCDKIHWFIEFRRLCFNPHTHAGCDSVYCYGWYDWRGFNPHTHAGCDLTSSGTFTYQSMFQSTHPRRVWPQARASMINAEQFQSTHPRRVWLLIIVNIVRLLRFNPHTHAGCDVCLQWRCYFDCSFQSTHPRRVWLLAMTMLLRLLVSIHTPTQGVTDYMTSAASSSKFQSTHPRRVWHGLYDFCCFF